VSWAEAEGGTGTSRSRWWSQGHGCQGCLDPAAEAARRQRCEGEGSRGLKGGMGVARQDMALLACYAISLCFVCVCAWSVTIYHKRASTRHPHPPVACRRSYPPLSAILSVLSQLARSIPSQIHSMLTLTPPLKHPRPRRHRSRRPRRDLNEGEEEREIKKRQAFPWPL
jgi:hypothetical protein